MLIRLLQHYPNTISPEAWKRFEYYSPMVRTIKFNFDPDHVSFQALNDISLFNSWNGNGYLLPNLTCLRYHALQKGSWPAALALFSPKVVDLQFDVSEDTFSPGWDLPLRLLPQRLPHLTYLAINTPSEPLYSSAHLVVKMLKELAFLSQVDLNPVIATNPIVWEALSTKESIRILCHGTRYPSVWPEDAVPRPRFGEGRFVNLTTITIALHYDQIITLFSASTPKSLAVITLTMYGLTCVADVGDCILVVASNCVDLERVTLQHAFAHQIDLSHIQPLFAHHDLYVLRLAMPLDLSDADVEKIALAFPWLEDLYLHPSPFGTEPHTPTLTLKALVSVARHAMYLERLTLYMDTSIVPTDAISGGYAYIQFDSLTDLNFGLSGIETTLDIFDVVLYLGDICAEGISIFSRLDDEIEDLQYGDPPLLITQLHEDAASTWQMIDEKFAALHERARVGRKLLEERALTT